MPLLGFRFSSVIFKLSKSSTPSAEGCAAFANVWECFPFVAAQL